MLLQNTPFFSSLLVAAGLTGIVPVGLNPIRRGAALERDIRHADCQVVLADSASAAVVGDIDHVDVDSPEWAAEVAAHRDAPVTVRAADPADMFMLIYTSGTSGDPKAVICSHGKVAIAGVMMTERFGLGPDDVCYVSMPLFHSNAVLVGWAVALACAGSMVLRRKFSASQFLPDVRRYGATYANYVGKPLSYVLATPERPDDADNPLRAVYGNEGAPARRRPVRPAGSAPSSSTDSVPPRAESRSAGHRTPRRARWARCPRGPRSSTSTPASRVRPASPVRS